ALPRLYAQASRQELTRYRVKVIISRLVSLLPERQVVVDQISLLNLLMTQLGEISLDTHLPPPTTNSPSSDSLVKENREGPAEKFRVSAFLATFVTSSSISSRITIVFLSCLFGR